MNRRTELLSVQSIILGDRLREDFGDIDALAESIQTWGLIHPLTVDADNNLIAGERRLRAMKQLGFMEVEVRRWEELSETQRQELELEENLRRKDLTSYERSKNLVKLAKVAKDADRETGEFRTDSVRKPAHRPEQPGSSRRVSERIGVPAQTIRDAKKHVAAAEIYPVFQKPGWKTYHVLEASEVIEKIPEEDRQPVAELIDQPYCPPQAAIPMLRNLAQMEVPERKKIISLADSEDSRDRSLALTRAAEKPPMPDERYLMLDGAAQTIRKAIKIHPNDPEVPDLRRIADDLKQVITTIQERNRDRHSQRTA